MNGTLAGLRSEAVGAMRDALVSAENLQLTLKSDLRSEERALTNKHSCESLEKLNKGYEKYSYLWRKICFVCSYVVVFLMLCNSVSS